MSLPREVRSLSEVLTASSCVSQLVRATEPSSLSRVRVSGEYRGYFNSPYVSQLVCAREPSSLSRVRVWGEYGGYFTIKGPHGQILRKSSGELRQYHHPSEDPPVQTTMLPQRQEPEPSVPESATSAGGLMSWMRNLVPTVPVRKSTRERRTPRILDL